MSIFPRIKKNIFNKIYLLIDVYDTSYDIHTCDNLFLFISSCNFIGGGIGVKGLDLYF